MLDRATSYEKPYHRSICQLHWSMVSVYFSKNQVKYCCKTPSYPLNQSEFARMGPSYFSNNSQITERRKSSLSGVRHKDCSECWALEDKGVQSTRSRGDLITFLNDFDSEWESKNGGDALSALEQLKASRDLTTEIRPRVLEIHLDTVCNMKCTYCSPYHSSLWAKEEMEFGHYSKENFIQETSGHDPQFEAHFWEWLKGEPLNSIYNIRFIGGEPLISPKFYDFIERLSLLLKNRNSHLWPIDLAAVTNLNLTSSHMEKLLAILPSLTKTNKFEFGLSMDCIGERAEYIRHGLKWNVWERNFETLLNLNNSNLSFSFQITISALNLSCLHELLSFIQNSYVKYGKPILLRRNIVSHSKANSPFSVPYSVMSLGLNCAVQKIEDFVPEIKDQAMKDNWIEYKEFLTGLLANHSNHEPDESTMKEFYLWFEKNDFRRGSRLTSVFSELEPYWHRCKILAVGTEKSI